LPERRSDFTRHGIKLRQQAPVRLVYCTPNRFSLSACCMCGEPPSMTCARCQLPYCAAHQDHAQRRSVPPDAWKSLRRRLRIQILEAAGLPLTHGLRFDYKQPMAHLEVDGHLVHASPPVRITYCRVPHARNLEAACAHHAQTCTTGQTVCPDCVFPYCDHHYPRHAAPLVVARPVWQDLMEQLEMQLEACALARGRRLIRLHVPRLDP
jgi:hypothetical protein